MAFTETKQRKQEKNVRYTSFISHGDSFEISEFPYTSIFSFCLVVMFAALAYDGVRAMETMDYPYHVAL